MPAITDAQQRAAARDFARKWENHGDEKQETSRFWIALLGDVLGIAGPADRIEFEKRVKLSHTSFIDGYIPETKVLIEQKSLDIDLSKAYTQSDGTQLTPFEQAKRYANEMPYDLRPRWIVVSNFREIHIHDMNRPADPPEVVRLAELEKDYYRLQFLVDAKSEYIRREEEISIRAGELVRKLYNALIKEYADPTAESLRSLNILCVRLVFCLYAEDAGLFATRTAFEDYIRSFNIQNVRLALINLFKALDTRPEDRDRYDETIRPFPYVNGGLFKDEKIEIPNFTPEIVSVIVNDCAPFNWADISPTIFGAVFESTLNPDTRRAGGMHYTSVENIHKVIDPLFMDALEAEFAQIMKTSSVKARRQQLHAFQKRLGGLQFLDPACGSGNFLTEAFLSLRRLENKVISALNDGETVLGLDGFIQVEISQFYGIEINDFAVTVAKTALWIAESQMIAETEKILARNIDFLPLKTNACIVEGNALRTDWTTLKPTDGNALPDNDLFAGITTHVDGSVHHYDFIMGNPPFVGARLMNEEQKKDVLATFGNIKNVGNLDYVACWYKKAADLLKNSDTRAALVSTNSITQGEQPAILWKPLMNDGIRIDFAHRTFRWDSESTQKAHVHCVIVGFSSRRDGLPTVHALNTDGQETVPPCRIFDGDNVEFAENINAYLVNAPDVFIESRTKSLCDVPNIGIGNKPIDGGNYLFSEEEKDEFVKKEPASEKYFRKWIGSDEFINRYFRFCLWLGACSPAELRKMPECLKRVEAVRSFRLASKSAQTQKLADMPTRFHVENMPQGDFIVIPKVSSEKRRYIPIGFMNADTFASDLVFVFPSATLYHFGILTSSVHMAWMRAVCGRLEMRYRYSKDIVYNNFPWPRKDTWKDGLPTVHCSETDAGKDTLPTVPNSETDSRETVSPCKFLDKNADVMATYRGHLPHWNQFGKLQFVTFRLADSLPQDKLAELRADKEAFERQHPRPWSSDTESEYYRHFGSAIDRWLDAGYGACCLRFPFVRKIVEDALMHFDGQRYRIHAFVIMPNHVHVLVEPMAEYTMAEILKSWKGFTATEINKVLGTTGALWMHESYDRIIRDEEHYSHVLQYIANNPKALNASEYTWRDGLPTVPNSEPDTEKDAGKDGLPTVHCSETDTGKDTLPTVHCSETDTGKDGLPTVPNSETDAGKDTLPTVPNSETDGRETVPPCEIARTAQAILDARAKYPDCSLADLYDETVMPPELRKAHQENDRAVMQAYGFDPRMTESEIVAELFRMYEALGK